MLWQWLRLSSRKQKQRSSQLISRTEQKTSAMTVMPMVMIVLLELVLLVLPNCGRCTE